MKLSNLDEWLFKGLSGIVNMLVRRVGLDEPYNKNCKLMLDHEIKRLMEVKLQVDMRQGESITESPFSVLDVWFVKCYEGINHWFDLRGREGPKMNPSSLDDLQKHIDRMQEIVNRERNK